MQKMGMAALAALGAWLLIAAPATAGDYTGDTLVRVQGTVVVPDSSAKVYSGGILVRRLMMQTSARKSSRR